MPICVNNKLAGTAISYLIRCATYVEMKKNHLKDLRPNDIYVFSWNKQSYFGIIFENFFTFSVICLQYNSHRTDRETCVGL